MITHHPSDESLARFAAGGLEAGPRLIVATHLSGCQLCRNRRRAFETVGGQMLEEVSPAALPADSFARTLVRLEEAAPIGVAPEIHDAEMPVPLRHYPVGAWRFVHPGLRWRRLTLPEAPEANVIMLKVAAGQKVPQHGHTGTEYTQVVTGGFSDSFGHYGAGDCIEMDEHVDRFR